MLNQKQTAWIKTHTSPNQKKLPMKGPTFGEIFVALPESGFLCQSCVDMCKLDIGSDAVEVWQVGSSGWTAPCVCSSCTLSIPVLVDG